MGYDAIVVGGRLAGASTALLLARQGMAVLVLDRAHFPSDTLSSHQLQVPGVARLARWGVLGRLLATGVPPTRDVRFVAGEAVIDSHVPTVDGADFMLSPRRTVLDALLLDAAQEAGAKVLEGAAVDALVDDRGRVAGVHYQSRGTGGGGKERAAIVIGADGRHSAVARLAGAATYRRRPASSVAAYAYWTGVEWSGGDIHSRSDAIVGAWPTHEGQVVTFLSLPATRWDELRAQPEATLRAEIAASGTLPDRLDGAHLVGPVRCTNDLVSEVRVPFGPGWALVGDAGLVMDPITGLGMRHALRDAELMAHTVSTALGNSKPFRKFQKRRDAETVPTFDFTAGLAEFRPTSAAEQRMFQAIAASSDAAAAFIAAITGAAPLDQFFSPRNLIKLVGLRGFLDLAKTRPR